MAEVRMFMGLHLQQSNAASETFSRLRRSAARGNPDGWFDTTQPLWDTENVKADKTTIPEKKTRGALIVEKYRPRMNKLTPAERQQLRDRAMQLAFGCVVLPEISSAMSTATH